MRVLLLSVTAGFGHHATAKAVSDLLKERGAVVDTIDVYEVINRFIKETIDKGYLFSSKHTKELYRLFYSKTAAKAIGQVRSSPSTSSTTWARRNLHAVLTILHQTQSSAPTSLPRSWSMNSSTASW